jgi:tRNA A-37 threonylcarbamoyl transferase component Bud32/predicted nucleotidyltransferase
MSTFDPLYKFRDAHSTGKIPDKVYRLVTERFSLVAEGIKRVEEASGLKYPYYYVEPSLVVSTSAAEFTQMGILFARTIPVVDDSRILRVVVQVTAPLIAYGLKGTIHAILAHEFMHYLELVSRIVKMKVISDEVSGTLFEGRYADAGRLLEERAVFKSDPTLIKHITTHFPEGFRDFKLEDKVFKLWMNKGLQTIRVPIDSNLIKIPIEAMANLHVEQAVRDKIAEFENMKLRKKKFTGYVSVSQQELQIIKKSISKVAKGRTVIAACLYGSKVAGYARPDSDIDLLVVLERYPYAIKYVYLSESGMEISALVVNRGSLESDAQSGSLGEFVAGRLLHVYESIINAEFLYGVERIYKRRIILEEMQNIIDSTSVLGTEILFPLEYVAFSKIKRRTALYPSAAYSYYKTYTGNKHNLEFALDGYRRALEEIVAEDGELFSRHDNLLQISDRGVSVEKGRIRLRLTKRLQEFSSYFVQTYAGRRIMHLAVMEAQSKISRHVRQEIVLPSFMSCPKGTYWQIPEGKLIIDSKDWADELARSSGLDNYSISIKRRIGNINSRTVLYVLRHDSGMYKIAVKELAKSKSIKWAALSLWTMPVKRFRVDALFRLASEYKAIRYTRSLGVNTPAIEAVVLDKKLLVTRFVEGNSLADVIKECMKNNVCTNFGWLREAGAQMAKIHNAGASLGNIKPKNVIVSNRGLYFTDLEQFALRSGDPAWDLAQFVSWGLKASRNSVMASKIVREFLDGYLALGGRSNIAKLARSRRYIESFYPVLAPSVVRAIKQEIRNAAG